MWGLFRRPDPANVTGAARSPNWDGWVKRFLRGKSCLACGQRDGLTGHHVVPFHLRPDLELVEAATVAANSAESRDDCPLSPNRLALSNTIMLSKLVYRMSIKLKL